MYNLFQYFISTNHFVENNQENQINEYEIVENDLLYKTINKSPAVQIGPKNVIVNEIIDDTLSNEIIDITPSNEIIDVKIIEESDVSNQIIFFKKHKDNKSDSLSQNELINVNEVEKIYESDFDSESESDYEYKEKYYKENKFTQFNDSDTISEHINFVDSDSSIHSCNSESVSCQSSEIIYETNRLRKDIPIVLVEGYFANDCYIFDMLENYDNYKINTFGTNDYYKNVNENVYNYFKNKSNCTRVIRVSLNPYGSNYDRAIQLFHEIKGEICYFGKKRSTESKKLEYDSSICIEGKYKEWNDQFPVHFVCFSMGGNTVRELMYLLENKKIPKFDNVCNKKQVYYDTNQNWIKSIITIASPLGGSSFYRELKDECVSNDLLSLKLVFPIIGWSLLLCKRSNTLQKLFMLDRCMYWNLSIQDSLFFSFDKLEKHLGNETAFHDISYSNCIAEINKINNFFKNKIKIPVLNIVLKNNEMNLHKQFYNYGENSVEYQEILQFKARANEYAFYIVDSGVCLYDIICPSSCEKKNYIQDIIFNIYKACVQNSF
jgi:hypothetical protein